MGKYLVTGGAGFIGSHVVEGLVGRGDTVRVVDDLSMGCRANLPAHDGLEFVEADLAAPGVAIEAVQGCGLRNSPCGYTVGTALC